MNKLKKSNKSGHDDGFFDDCLICQAMKKEGIKMRQYPNKAGENKGKGIREEGFYAAPIDPKKLDKIKEIFKKNGGTVTDEDIE